MPPSSTETDPRRPRARRLARLAWGLAAGFILLLVAADARLTASPWVGYAPEGATWRLISTDLPGLFKTWNQLEASTRMREASPAFHRDVPLAIRKMTGVRPTPLRTRIWLGRTALVAGDANGWCASFRPGILMRFATLFVDPLRKGDDPDFWRGYVSTWRDGFLLLASSPDYLPRAESAPAPVERPALSSRTLRFSWTTVPAGVLDLSVDGELPFRVTMDAPADTPGDLHFSSLAPGAMGSINLHSGTALATALRNSLGWAESRVEPERMALMREVASAWWSAYCPLDLRAFGGAEWYGALLRVEPFQDMPVVESLWAVRPSGSADLATLIPPAASAHRWGEREGWLIPVPGDARAWAVVQRGEDVLVASSEAAMAAALATTPTAPQPGTGAFQLQWKPVASALASTLRRGVQDGWLPGIDEERLEGKLVPRIEAFSNWGTLEFNARAEDGKVVVEGALARSADAGS